MKQHVNFIYHPPPVPSLRFSLRQLLMVCAITLGIIILAGIIESWRLYSSVDTLADLQAQRQQNQQKLMKLIEKKEKLKKNDKTSQLTEMIDKKQALIKYLKTQGKEEKSRINQVFRAMGESAVPKVWLTHIEIEKLGHKTSLEGGTVEPAQVYHFLDRLNHNKRMNHLEFYLKQITSSPKNSYDTFTIYTEYHS